MEYTADERAMLWLCACTELSERERVAALRCAKCPSRIMEDAEEVFAAAHVSAQSARTRKRREEETDRMVESLSRKKQFFVSLAGEDYPEALSFIPSPPLLLYGQGRRELLKKEKFCIVGSRITPPWAAALGKRVAGELTAHFVIVTGIAEGGDRAAIEGASDSGELISVLPCGLDECYPAAHAALKAAVAERGLLLTELPPQDKAKKYSFHARNRLLAGLTRGTLVISAGEKSGALITANCALDYGRDVFAFPHNAGAAQGVGCNDLLKKGAYVATEAADILSVYGFESKPSAQTLSEEERRVYDALKARGEAHAAQLAADAGMQPFEVLPVLSSLELKGLAVKAGGNRYQAV